MMLNTTFNNISVILWRSVSLVGKTGVPRKNHQASHWQPLTHNVVSNTPRHVRGSNVMLVVIGTDCIDSCKSSYHPITTAPQEWTIQNKR